MLSSKLVMSQPKDPLNQTIRLVLLPLGTYAFFLSCTFRDFSLGVPSYNIWNYGMGLTCFAATMKLVEVSFKRERPVRLAESVAVSSSDSEQDASGKERGASSSQPNGNGKPPKKRADYKIEPADGSLTQVIAYLADPRGIRYEYDPRAFRSPEARVVKNRASFLLQTLESTVIHIGVFDLCQTIIQSIPGTTAGTPQGGSIFVPSIPSIWRYCVSTVMVLSMGLGVYAGLEAGHNITTLFSVGVCRADPADHPPMFWKPWAATSVRELWSKYVPSPSPSPSGLTDLYAGAGTLSLRTTSRTSAGQSALPY